MCLSRSPILWRSVWKLQNRCDGSLLRSRGSRRSHCSKINPLHSSNTELLRADDSLRAKKVIFCQLSVRITLFTPVSTTPLLACCFMTPKCQSGDILGSLVNAEVTNLVHSAVMKLYECHSSSIRKDTTDVTFMQQHQLNIWPRLFRNFFCTYYNSSTQTYEIYNKG